MRLSCSWTMTALITIKLCSKLSAWVDVVQANTCHLIDSLICILDRVVSWTCTSYMFTRGDFPPDCPWIQSCWKPRVNGTYNIIRCRADAIHPLSWPHPLPRRRPSIYGTAAAALVAQCLCEVLALTSTTYVCCARVVSKHSSPATSPRRPRLTTVCSRGHHLLIVAVHLSDS
jgi:hypothetical protein